MPLARLPRSIGPCGGRSLLAAATICSFAAGWSAEAQRRQTPNPRPPASTPAPASKSASTPGFVEFSDEPLKIESVGLTMKIPVGSTAQMSRAGDQIKADIHADDLSWLITVQVRRPQATHTPNAGDAIESSKTPKPLVSPDESTISTEEVARKAYELLLGSLSVLNKEGKVVETKAKTLSKSDTLTLAGLPASQFYVACKAENEAPYVRGYTVVHSGAGRFVSFELFAAEEDFAKAKAVYETTINTAVFTDPLQLETVRAGAIDAGVRVLGQLGQDDYRAIIGDGKARTTRWERLFRPSQTGAEADAEEIAYRQVQSWVGRRGELDPQRDRSTWGVQDRTEGYLVQISLRILEGNYQKTGAYTDAQGTYFLGFDRSEEAWTLRTTRRQAKATATYSETGARVGRSMSVITSSPGDPPTTNKPHVPAQGYLSQLELFILPQLLIRSEAPLDYGFYVYQSREGNVRYRVDSLVRLDDGKGNATGWQLKSKQGEDQPAQVSLFRGDGSLVRTELPDGRVWETVTVEHLRQLWQSKQLPTSTPKN
jgi:hypothetical protein